MTYMKYIYMNYQTSSLSDPVWIPVICLEHSTKTASQMIQTGIPTIRALQVVALVASPVLRSALSHDTLHCPAASSFVDRTYRPWYLVLGFGGSISTKSYIVCSFNKILQYSSQHIEKTNGKKTQSIEANGSRQEPFSQLSLRVNDDRLLFLAIAIGHIRHAVHLSKTCCGSTLTQISASRCPE